MMGVLRNDTIGLINAPLSLASDLLPVLRHNLSVSEWDMSEAASGIEGSARNTSASALLLLQAAAARAEIGPFARRGRATPQAAAGSYRMAARLAGEAASGRS